MNTIKIKRRRSRDGFVVYRNNSFIGEFVNIGNNSWFHNGTVYATSIEAYHSVLKGAN